MNYFDHIDRAGLDQRLLVLNCREARARYLAALAEYEANDITLFMSKRELQARLTEAKCAHDPWYALETRVAAWCGLNLGKPTRKWTFAEVYGSREPQQEIAP